MNFINILNHILRPLEWVVAQLLTLFHHALVTFGMTAGPSPAWGIAIMCLVLVIRICLLPLFLSQMRAMQRIQVLQPQIQRIQHKYAARKDPLPKKPCNVKSWPCSSDITPIRLAPACLH